MSSYLNILGISESIQNLFFDFYTTDNNQNLLFSYGNNNVETFGFNKHLIPRNSMSWKAVNCSLSNVSTVYLFESALEAVCFSQYKHSLTASWNIENSLFLSLGKTPSLNALEWIMEHLAKKYFVFVFPNTLLGKVFDCKMAALISGKEIKITHSNEFVFLDYKNETFRFPTKLFSLTKVRKVTGIQNRIGKAEKAPAGFSSFKEYIFSNAGF